MDDLPCRGYAVLAYLKHAKLACRSRDEMSSSDILRQRVLLRHLPLLDYIGESE